MGNDFMQQHIIGWDIGGAHLKAAWLNEQGEILGVYQAACPLWQGMETLEIALAEIETHFPEEIKHHVITMTGELVDLFTSREAGVMAILAVIEKNLATKTVNVYAGRLGFINLSEVKTSHINDIASANWHASASYAAQHCSRGLFVDIGSTTTDILLLENKQVQAQGYTDFQRLQSAELVYTGIVRTAVMAVAGSVIFKGVATGVMREYFATMADVYRLTEELEPQHDQSETADGAEKTIMASARRLARMLGCDIEDFDLSDWQSLSQQLREQQRLSIQAACERQLLSQPATLIGAGIGRFLVQEIAQRLGCEYRDFGDLLVIKQQSTMQAADCAPAVAIAYLANHSEWLLVK